MTYFQNIGRRETKKHIGGMMSVRKIKKPFSKIRKALLIEVVPAGFEPATHGFSVRCSTN